MTVIGICGGSGSGKTQVSQILQTRGIPVFESDDVYHGLIAAPSLCTREIAAEFGEGVLAPDGSVDRDALREIVFSASPEAPARLARLNQLSHRYVREAFIRWSSVQRTSDAPCIAMEAPLLFESGMDALCDAIVAVTAPVEVRVQRIMKRDGLSEEQAYARIRAQCTDEQLLARCDYVIQNGGTMNDIPEQIDHIIMKILSSKGLKS